MLGGSFARVEVQEQSGPAHEGFCWTRVIDTLP
jgi:hypothetical protein